MIRERVSTQGVIRPLEAEHELAAFSVPPEKIGQLPELAIRRYIEARAKFDKKFGSTKKVIDKHRLRNLELDRTDTKKNMDALQDSLMRYENMATDKGTGDEHADRLIDSAHWSWAWVLDEHERPPPSSITSRRDTAEARRLAKIADESVFQNDKSLSGNNFWSLVVNFFTVMPDRDERDTTSEGKHEPKISHMLRHGHRERDPSRSI